MKKNTWFIPMFIVIGLVGLTACRNDKENAKESVVSFFKAATDSAYSLSVKDLYPLFDSLRLDITSDVLDISDNIVKKNDTMMVACQNSYTDSYGVFKQDSLTFYLLPNSKTGKYYISNSQGLVKISSDMGIFAKTLGLDIRSNMKDLELAHLQFWLYQYYTEKAIEAYVDLMTGVVIKSWNWDTYYDGEPHGEAWIVNNTNQVVEGIEYVVKYFDYKGNLLTEDTGNACNRIQPGEKYRFTFYSSHVIEPSKANLKLNFKAASINNYVLSQEFTKEDFFSFVSKKQMKKSANDSKIL
ncbi:hypothetical protein [uncultured Bacteroides sp.]|uniref:hypothetical protein n=1 Tax=uncultured Bacteroides sp. TaxID=162156 RepID=UPI002612122B|nr:hypothetical protein [uncultured Bacteroides sp.]